MLGENESHIVFRYVDLCAGIGGFHQAMKSLGGKCVGAAEVNDSCVDAYRTNFPGTPMLGDITTIDRPSDIPAFDLVCAGFPCQPFGKAGKQLGFEDKSRGNCSSRSLTSLMRTPKPKALFSRMLEILPTTRVTGL